MDVTQTAWCLATPYQLLACVNLQRIAAQPPAGQFQADVADDGLALQLISNPGGRKSAVILPLRQFVVIEAACGMLRVIARLGCLDAYANGTFLI